LWQQADSSNTCRLRSDVPNNRCDGGANRPGTREYLPGVPAAAWRETSLHLLNQQAPATHPDGANKEQARCHRFIAELLLLMWRAVARVRCRIDIPEDTAWSGMLVMSLQLVPVGTAPMWGDSDQTLGLGQNRDFRTSSILSAAAVGGLTEIAAAFRRRGIFGSWAEGLETRNGLMFVRRQPREPFPRQEPSFAMPWSEHRCRLLSMWSVRPGGRLRPPP
jgi:hypothetical protein